MKTKSKKPTKKVATKVISLKGKFFKYAGDPKALINTHANGKIEVMFYPPKSIQPELRARTIEYTEQEFLKLYGKRIGK